MNSSLNSMSRSNFYAKSVEFVRGKLHTSVLDNCSGPFARSDPQVAMKTRHNSNASFQALERDSIIPTSECLWESLLTCLGFRPHVEAHHILRSLIKSGTTTMKASNSMHPGTIILLMLSWQSNRTYLCTINFNIPRFSCCLSTLHIRIPKKHARIRSKHRSWNSCVAARDQQCRVSRLHHVRRIETTRTTPRATVFRS